MGRFIIKPVQDVDFYIEYSTVVDSPTFGGNRETMLKYPEVTEERLARADARGTSSYIGDGEWSDDTIWVREGVDDPTRPENSSHGEVKREDIQAFYESLDASGRKFHPPAGMVKWITWDDLEG